MLQMSLFDEANLAEITHPDYPGERLVACRNPALAVERSRKRDELLAATEADLGVIQAATTRQRRPLLGKDKIALRVGKVINAHKMAKHFELTIGEAGFSFTRKSGAIAAEAALDGIYVVRASAAHNAALDSGAVVEVTTRTSPSSKAASAASRPSTWICALSTTGPSSGCGPTC